MADVKSLLVKIKQYYKDQGKENALVQLNPPATDKDIKRLEDKLPKPMRLDRQYIEFLKLHNGSHDGFRLLQWTPLSVGGVLSNWSEQNHRHPEGAHSDAKLDPDAGVQKVWWDHHWVPIFSDHNGDYLCLDFNPAQGGKIGQVIWYAHDDGSRIKIGSNFADALDRLVHQHMNLYDEYKKRKEVEEKQNQKKSPSWLEWIKSKI